MNIRKIALGMTMLTAAAFTVMAHPVNAVFASDDSYTFKAKDYTYQQLLNKNVANGNGSFTDLESVLLRQITNQCPGTSHPPTDTIDTQHLNLVDHAIHMQLDQNTTTSCYNASEFFLGQSQYLDQPTLDAAFARNDARVFTPGKKMSFKAKFSEAFKDKSALGTAGLAAQGWNFRDLEVAPGVTISVPAYVAAGIVYFPDINSNGQVIPAGFYTLVADLGSGYFNLTPITTGLPDVTEYHKYTVKWDAGNVFTFKIDGNVIQTVTATGMTSDHLYAHVGTWVDNNDFSQGLSVAGTGSVFTKAESVDVKTIKVKTFEDDDNDD